MSMMRIELNIGLLATCTELPHMIGKGGIKIIYEKLMELEEQLNSA